RGDLAPDPGRGPAPGLRRGRGPQADAVLGSPGAEGARARTQGRGAPEGAPAVHRRVRGGREGRFPAPVAGSPQVDGGSASRIRSPSSRIEYGLARKLRTPSAVSRLRVRRSVSAVIAMTG